MKLGSSKINKKKFKIDTKPFPVFNLFNKYNNNKKCLKQAANFMVFIVLYDRCLSNCIHVRSYSKLRNRNTKFLANFYNFVVS